MSERDGTDAAARKRSADTGTTDTSHPEGPYLFDVGVIALAHTNAPVRDAAFSYVRRAIAGEIEAVVPSLQPSVSISQTNRPSYYST